MKAFAYFILLSIVLSCSKEPDYRDKYVGVYRTELFYIHRDINIIQKDTGLISIEKDTDEDSGLILHFGTKMRFEKPPVGTVFYYSPSCLSSAIIGSGKLSLKMNSVGGLNSNYCKSGSEEELYIYSNLQLCLAFDYSNYFHSKEYLSVRYNGTKL